MKSMKNVPKAVQDCHLLLEWLIPHLDKFPRLRRFTLGERIESGLLEILERLIEAAYSREKLEALRCANLRLDVVRHLWRLSYSLQVIPMQRYEHGAKLMETLGRQIGAWKRAGEAAP
ncbi:MAG: diversity-generating retroelement protein Avd [Gammaproteobacteria bacterium]